MRGGKREGSGRKKGSVSPARKAQLEAARAAVEAVFDGQETPLEYMLRIMRDSSVDDKRRDAMALGAASFVHPKLAAVEHSGNEDAPLSFQIISGVPRADDDESRVNGFNGHADH